VKTVRPDIAEKISALPDAPGIYVMKGKSADVLYIGKATSLRSRLRQYFSGTDQRAFVALLDELLSDIEVILTHNAKEALILENELIKQHQPRFNVKLTDDSRYLCLRLDVRQPYPRLEIVRQFRRDGARYFGPYSSASDIRETVRIINRYFQLRTCSDEVLHSRKRPCLQYQIQRCPGPCVFPQSESYAQNVQAVIDFLEGRTNELVEGLTARMQRHSTTLEFEHAARIRDQIRAVERSMERQRVVTADFANRDVIG
jgi:excinuclease ABC subunit C